jgi:sialate O-acetylesterase
MRKTPINRRQFMLTGAAATALGLAGNAEAFTHDSRLGTNSDRNSSDDGIPLLAQDYQVLQRDNNDHGACRMMVPSQEKASVLAVHIVDDAGRTWMDTQTPIQNFGSDSAHIVVEKIPVGGPYIIRASSPGGGNQEAGIVFRNILVGDIWILGGQSNMYGIALAEENLPALPYLNMLNVMHTHMDSSWCAGIPPLHRLPDELAEFHLKAQYPGITDLEIKQRLVAKVPVGGIGPAYFFAKHLYEAGSDVPLGVIPCATGAALAVWDPAKRDQNRYGFLYHHMMRAGGKVKGMLWYQGEQDAIFGDEEKTVTQPSLIYPVSTYAADFKKFVESLRSDFQNPELVVVTAQICRHHNGKKERHKFWEQMREIQRSIPDQVPNVHVVPTVDLDELDGLHLDYWSQKRLGRRMAYVAFPYIKKEVPRRTEIKLKSVYFGHTAKPSVVVEFTAVSGKLRAPGRPTGFQLRNRDTGEDLEWIFKVNFTPDDPQKVILELAGKQQPTESLILLYAPGSTPFVNIVDENDMAIPAFGPVPVGASPGYATN